MKRDIDLFRDLLMQIEQEPPCEGFDKSPWRGLGIGGKTTEEIKYHVKMLLDRKFLYEDAINLDGRTDFGPCVKYRPDAISDLGHEFLDDIRDEDVWKKTKARSKIVIGAGIGFMWEIAKAEVRKKLGLP